MCWSEWTRWKAPRNGSRNFQDSLNISFFGCKTGPKIHKITLENRVLMSPNPIFFWAGEAGSKFSDHLISLFWNKSIKKWIRKFSRSPLNISFLLYFENGKLCFSRGQQTRSENSQNHPRKSCFWCPKTRFFSEPAKPARKFSNPL